jgi:heat shock protein HslJ
MSVGPLGSTMLACSKDVMAQAGAFTSALEKTASYAVDGTTLTLSGADGSFVLALEGTAA